MTRSFWRLSPTLVGFFASGLGLIWYYWLTGAANAFFSSGSCGWNLMSQTLWPIQFASVIGFLGSVVFLVNRSAGGGILVVAGIVFLFPVAVYGVYFFWWIVFFLLVPDLFFGLLLILSGLLAFPKTRKIVKGLHEGGWIP